MGCKQTKVSPMNQTSPEEALEGNINCPHEFYYARSQTAPQAPRLTGKEVLKQLRQERIVPDRHASGGVAFSVPTDDSLTPRGKPPRRLERLPVKGEYSSEERKIMADVFIYDKMVEQVQRKALDRDIKRPQVRKEERRQRLKKMLAEQKLMDREERLRKFEEEKAAKRKQGKSKNAKE